VDPVTVSVVALAVLFMINMPVGFAIALATLLYFDSQQALQVGLLFQRMISGTESFPLLAVPFFLMTGVLMNYAGITPRLVRLADALTGHRIGGLAQVNVVASTLMGGMSGSANADAAMMSKILVPEMVARGYPVGFASAVTASSALIGPIIPPGIGLIIYGFLANVSIGRMFIAGVIPGILMCGALMVAVDIVSKGRGYKPSRDSRATASERWLSLRDAGPALLLPLAVIGGIRFGVFTPTEAGAMAVVYAAIIGVFMYRDLKPRHLPMILRESLNSTAVVMLIIAAASAFGWMLSYEQIPQRTADFLTSLSDNPLVVLLVLNVTLLIAGMFIEGTAILIIVTPILVPTAVALGIDPVHFGIVLVLNLTIGGITPPLGTVMYTTCSITRATVSEFARENMPLLAVLILVLLLLTYVPMISLFLPNLLMGN
jgi:tripartite ATP-independent transporter DctM subunit